jgi:hypothetical protein
MNGDNIAFCASLSRIALFAPTPGGEPVCFQKELFVLASVEGM